GGAAGGSGPEAAVVVVEGAGAGSPSAAPRSGAAEDDVDSDSAGPAEDSTGAVTPAASSQAADEGHSPEVPDASGADDAGPEATKGQEATTTAIPIVEPGSRT
ncbi:hypothetical protein D477_003313, partial [Arthrobacter crystallopoietes BAB-32]